MNRRHQKRGNFYSHTLKSIGIEGNKIKNYDRKMQKKIKNTKASVSACLGNTPQAFNLEFFFGTKDSF